MVNFDELSRLVVDKTVESAEESLRDAGYAMRIVVADGEPQGVIADHIGKRVNVESRHARVVRVLNLG